MLRLNKNHPKNGPVCHTCCVGKDFGFGGRWKLIIFGRETGKSKKTPISFRNFCSQQGKCCSISSSVEELVPSPILLCPFLSISLSPFAAFCSRGFCLPPLLSSSRGCSPTREPPGAASPPAFPIPDVRAASAPHHPCQAGLSSAPASSQPGSDPAPTPCPGLPGSSSG